MRTVLILLSIGLLVSCSTEVKRTTQPLTGGESIEGANQLDPNSALAESTTDDQQNEVTEGYEVYCTKVKPTGSRIPVKYCRTRSDDAKNREIARGWVDEVKKMPQQSIDGG